MTDAQRYQALKKFLLESGIVTHHPAPLDDTEPFAMGPDFYGETFDAAVDTLAEFRESIQMEIDELAPRLQARAAIDREIDI